MTDTLSLSKSLTPSQTRTDERAQALVSLYGDLLFDFCEALLWNPANAQLAFRSILKELSRRSAENGYVQHERAWVLRIACEELRDHADRHGRKLTPAEQLALDANPTLSSRLKDFDSYFHRLSTEDQMLMLLRDKYGIPFAEIAAALGSPEGSLKIRRQQALRALEEWLWEVR